MMSMQIPAIHGQLSLLVVKLATRCVAGSYERYYHPWMEDINSGNTAQAEGVVSLKECWLLGRNLSIDGHTDLDHG